MKELRFGVNIDMPAPPGAAHQYYLEGITMRDFFEEIDNMDPYDLEDLREEMPGLDELLDDRAEGYDAEDMLEDYDVDADELGEYLDDL